MWMSHVDSIPAFPYLIPAKSMARATCGPQILTLLCVTLPPYSVPLKVGEEGEHEDTEADYNMEAAECYNKS